MKLATLTQLDGDVTLQLVLEPDGLHPGDGLYDGGLSVGYMANRANVDSGLARNHLRRQWSQLGNVLRRRRERRQ